MHCTLQGEDLFLDGLTKPHRAEALDLIRKNAASVDRFTAVSEYYADFMAGYLSIPREKIDVVPLGINLQGFERRRSTPPDRPFTVGYLARVAPEKGLAVPLRGCTCDSGRCRASPARVSRWRVISRPISRTT